MIKPFDGLLNCTLTLTDWPGARLPAPGTAMKGVPALVPVAFDRVTPVGKFVSSTRTGPVIAWLPVLVTINLPLNVPFTRLYKKPVPVTLGLLGLELRHFS